MENHSYDKAKYLDLHSLVRNLIAPHKENECRSNCVCVATDRTVSTSELSRSQRDVVPNKLCMIS